MYRTRLWLSPSDRYSIAADQVRCHAGDGPCPTSKEIVMFLRSHPISVALLMAGALAIPMSAETKMKIASVGPQYTPKAGSQLPEPVSMRGYFFEVERETG